MIEVPLDIAVKSKAALEKPIYGKSGQILLQAGVVLTREYADRLKKMGIYSVYIQGGRVRSNPVVCEKVRSRAIQVLRSMVQSKNEKIDVLSVVNEILQDVFKMKGIVDNMLSISTYDGYTFSHSVDVCALAMSIGIQMGFQRSALMEIGMGALLHDIGKIKISEYIVNKPGRLDEHEFAEIKKHPELGYNIIKNHPQITDRSIAMVLEHHERWDGSGYPHKKKGNNIHWFSGICGVADVYSAMVSNRCYRKAYPHHEVYEMVLGLGDTHFDFEIVQAFAKCVVPYPSGILVYTSDGRIAQVTNNNLEHPYLPGVVFLDDDSNEEVDLSKAGITIKRPISLDEIESLTQLKELQGKLIKECENPMNTPVA